MIKQFLKFSSDEIEKKKFHSFKCQIDVNKIIVSEVFAYDKNLKKADAKLFSKIQR